jgi:hypothetical protein
LLGLASSPLIRIVFLNNAVPRLNEVIGSLIVDYLLEIRMNKLFSFAVDGIWKI